MPSIRSSRTAIPQPQPQPYPLPGPGARSMSMSTSSTSSQHKQRIGRGGAGNVVIMDTIPSPPTTLISLDTRSTASSSLSSHSAAVRTGRGGAGNFTRIPSEKRLFQFDEELAVQLQRRSRIAPVYHVGRGGVGNTAKPQDQSVLYIEGCSRRGESSATDSSSEKSGSEASAPRNIMKKIGRTVGKAGFYIVG